MDERYQKVWERFDKEIRTGQVRVHRAFSGSIYDIFEDYYFDWIYIDGNHLYEFVKQDLQLYYPKVKPGGCITGDDYGAQGWWENGVQRAVDKHPVVFDPRLRDAVSPFISRPFWKRLLSPSKR